MTRFEFATIFTVIGVPLLVFAARKASNNFPEGLAGGIGAGLGICWRNALGFDDISITYDLLFIAVGILSAFGLVWVLRRKE